MSETMHGLVMKYFVLKPAGDDAYAQASRQAMRKYADVIARENPELAFQLRQWTDQENAETYARSLESPPQVPANARENG